MMTIRVSIHRPSNHTRLLLPLWQDSANVIRWCKKQRKDWMRRVVLHKRPPSEMTKCVWGTEVYKIADTMGNSKT